MKGKGGHGHHQGGGAEALQQRDGHIDSHLYFAPSEKMKEFLPPKIADDKEPIIKHFGFFGKFSEQEAKKFKDGVSNKLGKSYTGGLGKGFDFLTLLGEISHGAAEAHKSIKKKQKELVIESAKEVVDVIKNLQVALVKENCSFRSKFLFECIGPLKSLDINTSLDADFDIAMKAIAELNKIVKESLAREDVKFRHEGLSKYITKPGRGLAEKRRAAVFFDLKKGYYDKPGVHSMFGWWGNALLRKNALHLRSQIRSAVEKIGKNIGDIHDVVNPRDKEKKIGQTAMEAAAANALDVSTESILNVIKNCMENTILTNSVGKKVKLTTDNISDRSIIDGLQKALRAAESLVVDKRDPVSIAMNGFIDHLDKVKSNATNKGPLEYLRAFILNKFPTGSHDASLNNDIVRTFISDVSANFSRKQKYIKKHSLDLAEALKPTDALKDKYRKLKEEVKMLQERGFDSATVRARIAQIKIEIDDNEEVTIEENIKYHAKQLMRHIHESVKNVYKNSLEGYSGSDIENPLGGVGELFLDASDPDHIRKSKMSKALNNINATLASYPEWANILARVEEFAMGKYRACIAFRPVEWAVDRAGEFVLNDKHERIPTAFVSTIAVVDDSASPTSKGFDLANFEKSSNDLSDDFADKLIKERKINFAEVNQEKTKIVDIGENVENNARDAERIKYEREEVLHGRKVDLLKNTKNYVNPYVGGGVVNQNVYCGDDEESIDDGNQQQTFQGKHNQRKNHGFGKE